jgi:hypothetical protein
MAICSTSGRRTSGTTGEEDGWVHSWSGCLWEKEIYFASTGAVDVLIYNLIIKIQAYFGAQLASYSKVRGFFLGNASART